MSTTQQCELLSGVWNVEQRENVIKKGRGGGEHALI